MSRIFALLCGLALWLSPASGLAGGLVLPGFGSQAQARAGAFVARADDPTALFHNPAGFAKQRGTRIQVVFNLVDYRLEFQRAGSYEAVTGEDLPYEGEAFPLVTDESTPQLGLGQFQLLPFVGGVSDLGGRSPVKIGFGIYAPHAYPDRNFAPDYQFEADPGEPPPPQRYDIMEQRAILAMPSIAAAYSVTDELDVGLRLSWGFGSAKASAYLWGIRNYEEWIARDGYVEVDTSDRFMPGFGLGALWRPAPAVEIGVAYDNGVHLGGKGWGSAGLGSGLGLPGQPMFLVPVADEYARCAPGGIDQDHLRACTTLDLPRTASVGGRWILRDGEGEERGDVELDVKWENWGAVPDVKVVVDGESAGAIEGRVLNDAYLRHGYRDVFSFRLGGSYQLPLSGGRALGLRGGVAYDTAAAPLRFTRLDQDGARRATFALGVAFATGDTVVELGGGLVVEPDRDVPVCNPTVSEPGCPEGSGDVPQSDRQSPDPLQPLEGPNNQIESPFNGGLYRAGYVLFSLGVTRVF